MSKKYLNKTITAVLLSGSLFFMSAGAVSAEEVVDLTLDSSVQMALENNRTIKQSYYDTDAARWALKEAKGQKGFSISWQGTAAAVAGSSFNVPTNNRDSSYGNVLEAAIPLYTGGQLENNIKANEIGVDISDFKLRKYKTTS